MQTIGHPSRGSGYDRRLGLIIDSDDVDGLERVLGREARNVIALVVAHEVGHHVQAQLRSGKPAISPAPGPDKELQADCYAGWSLARSGLDDQTRWKSNDDLRRRLARALQVLSVLQSGTIPLRRNEQHQLTHGSLSERVEAVAEGFSADEPWQC